MALQKDLIFSDGVELPSAYIKIVRVTFNYIEPYTVAIMVNMYKDFQAYVDKKPEVRQLEFICEGNNYITFFSNEKLETMSPQNCAYNWLRTFEMFSGALSV